MHSCAAFTYLVFWREVIQQPWEQTEAPRCWTVFFSLGLVQTSSLLWGQSQMRKMVKENLLDYRRAIAALVIYYQKQLCCTEGKPAQQICSNSLLIWSEAPILHSVAFLRVDPIPGTARGYPCAIHYFFFPPQLWNRKKGPLPFSNFVWPNEKVFCNYLHIQCTELYDLLGLQISSKLSKFQLHFALLILHYHT